GRDSLPCAEPPRERQRGDEIRSGGRPREVALLAGGSPSHRERLRLGNRDHLVEVLVAELRWPEADPSALDVVRPRRPAGEHGRLRRLDRDAKHPGKRLPQLTSDAEEAAGRPDVYAEGVDPAVKLPEQLPAQGAVAVDHVG